MVQHRTLLSMAIVSALGLGIVACSDDDEDKSSADSAGSSVVGLMKLDQFDSESEIVTFDPITKSMFSIGGNNALNIVDLAAPDG